MPEENETTTQQSGADSEEAVDQTAADETSAQAAGDATDAEETAPEAATEAEEKPFDRKQTEAKIHKANKEAEGLRKRLKELQPLADELQRIKDAEKSDTERLTDQLNAANERIAATRKRLVKTQVQALAGASFADPEDAVGALDLDSYIDSDGDINEAAITADLQELLERKPHWAKAQPLEGPRRPAPDRTQASGAKQTRSLDPAEEFAGFLKERLK